jgi:hypothetical protein
MARGVLPCPSTDEIKPDAAMLQVIKSFSYFQGPYDRVKSIEAGLE